MFECLSVNNSSVSPNERQDASPGPVNPRQPHDFEEVYQGKPAWDIDRPQPALVDLTSTGALKGRVLDVGCGTGEHALMAAAAGCDAAGIDMAARAIAIAERKSRDRGLKVRSK